MLLTDNNLLNAIVFVQYYNRINFTQLYQALYAPLLKLKSPLISNALVSLHRSIYSAQITIQYRYVLYCIMRVSLNLVK